MSVLQVSTQDIPGLSDDFWGDLLEGTKGVVGEVGGDLIESAKDKTKTAAEDAMDKLLGGGKSGSSSTTPTGSTGGVVPPGPYIQPPGAGTTTPPTGGTITSPSVPDSVPTVISPPPAATTTEKENVVISTVKQIHPAFLGAGIGVLTWFLSKSVLGAGLAGAGTWLLTDKLTK